MSTEMERQREKKEDDDDLRKENAWSGRVPS